jgi:hypothetical protein
MLTFDQSNCFVRYACIFLFSTVIQILYHLRMPSLRAIGAEIRMGSAWGSKNRPETSYRVIVGFFRDRVMQINNDGHFTVNFMLLKHYFWPTLVLELCKLGCVNKYHNFSGLGRAWCHSQWILVWSKKKSASSWDLSNATICVVYADGVRGVAEQFGLQILQWELGQERAYCEN